MISRYLVCAGFILFFIKNESNAQSFQEPGYPVIGKPCPYFSFKNVEDSEEKEINLRNLKGKPFILDFFATGCTMCFASFPKINKLRKDFAGKVRFLLIGRDDKYIRPSYSTFKKRNHLDLPHTYGLSIFEKWKISAVPLLIWIGADGKIKAVTTTTDLTDLNIRTFIQNRPFTFTNFSYDFYSISPQFDYHKSFLVQSNGGIDSAFFQRSLFAVWKPGMGYFALNNIEVYKKLGVPLQIIGWPLSSLYKFAYTNRIADWTMEDTAYYGKYHYSPVYETADSMIFKFTDDNLNNLLCYSQILRRDRSEPERMQSIMKDDLSNCFGYKVSIEIRQMPYLRLLLTNTNTNNLRSKVGDIVEESSIGGIHFTHGTMKELINIISSSSSLVSKDLPLLDETGIDYPIDIRFEAMMTDINDIKKELHNYGLEIVPGYKDMKVLVIRDKN